MSQQAGSTSNSFSSVPRPQFTLRALLVTMLVVAAFFGGIRFERERRRRADEAANPIDFYIVHGGGTFRKPVFLKRRGKPRGVRN